MTFRVLVGVPTSDYVHKNFAMSMIRMTRFSKLNLCLSLASGSIICQNRITIANTARRIGAKYVFYIDNDMSFPEHTADRLVHIAEEHNYDILGCNYLFKNPPHRSMAQGLEGKDMDLSGIDEIGRLPNGMLLIRTSVFDALEEPWFIYAPASLRGKPTIKSEDYIFCDNARAAGFKVYMDSILSLELVHWGSPMGVQWTMDPPHYRYVTDPSELEVE